MSFTAKYRIPTLMQMSKPPRPLKILVLDDNLRILETMLCPPLREARHTVFTATNAEDAMAIFKRESPDLVLSDISLSFTLTGNEHDGTFFITQIKTASPTTPCIAMSGFLDTSQQPDPRDVGPADMSLKKAATNFVHDLNILINALFTRNAFSIRDPECEPPCS